MSHLAVLSESYVGIFKMMTSHGRQQRVRPATCLVPVRPRRTQPNPAAARFSRRRPCRWPAHLSLVQSQPGSHKAVQQHTGATEATPITRSAPHPQSQTQRPGSQGMPLVSGVSRP